ncbi:MAG: hypothetical protein WCS77_04995 [Elusimicrobiaceae bacterium]
MTRIIKLLFAIFALLAGLQTARAGDAAADSVPLKINYQGRLEQQSAPVTGQVYMTFSIEDASQACFWGPSPCANTENAFSDRLVTVTQGIFGVTLEPPAAVIYKSGAKYLRVVVDTDRLSPPELLHSVPYAIVAKALADGSSISVSTSIATYSYVEGALRTNKLYINGQEWISPSSVSVSGIYADNEATISVSTAGHILFNVGTNLIGAISKNGNTMLINTTGYPAVEPAQKLVIDGGIGLYPGTRNYLALTTKSGVITQPGAEYADTDGLLRVYPKAGANYESALEIYARTDGDAVSEPSVYARAAFEMTASTLAIRTEIAPSGGAAISFETAGQSRLVISTYGYVATSSGTFPGWVYASSDVYVQTGLKAGNITIAKYGGIAGPNEIKSDGTSLIIQSDTGTFVGVGISTPSAKLHVNGNAYFENSLTVGRDGNNARVTIIATNTAVQGNFSAYTQGFATTVDLASTTVHGYLDVKGGISVNGLTGAFLNNDQTFLGVNTFNNRVHISSGFPLVVGYAAVPSWLPSKDFALFGGSSSDSARISIAAGSGSGMVNGSADSGLFLYRGSTEAARITTAQGSNAKLFVNSAERAYFDETGNISFNMQSSSPTNMAITGGGFNLQHQAGAGSDIYVSSASGNVGIGTNTISFNDSYATPKLTVAGDIRLPKSGTGIIFPDNTVLTSANALEMTASAVSNANDAVIAGGAASGIGSVIMRIGGSNYDMVIRNKTGSGSSNVGIGTYDPAERLHLNSGNIRVGTMANPFTALYPLNNVVIENGIYANKAAYFAFDAGSSMGVGTKTPAYKLDVQGSGINTSGIIATAGTERISAAGLLSHITGLGFSGAGPYNITTDNANISIRPGTGKIGLGTDASGSYGVNVGGGNVNLSDGALYMNGTSVISTARVLDNVQGFYQYGGVFSSTASSVFLKASGPLTLSGTAFGVDSSGRISTAYAGADALTLSGAGAGIKFSGSGVKAIDTTSTNLQITAGTANLVLSNTGNSVTAGAGTAGITVSGGSNSFMATTGSSTMAFTAAGLGVGTTSPGAKLDVNGDAMFGSGAAKSTFTAAGALQLSQALTISNGGTGATSLTANGVLYGNGTSAVSSLAPGTQNYVLQANGAAAPSWAQATQSNVVNTVVRRDSNGDVWFNEVNATSVRGIATSARNIVGGDSGSLPYQSAANTTVFLSAPSLGADYMLYYPSGAIAPSWQVVSSANTNNAIVKRNGSGDFSARNITATLLGTASAANAVNGGAAGSLLYQSALNTTVFLGAPSAGADYALFYSNGGSAPAWRGVSSANTANYLVTRDTNGDFSARNITATLLGTANTATAVSGGTTGALHYQSAPNTTAFLAAPSAGSDYALFYSNGGSAPAWRGVSSANTANYLVTRDASGDFSAHNITATSFIGTVTTAANLAGGSATKIPYQTGLGTTSFIAAPGSGDRVLFNANGSVTPTWQSVTSANNASTIMARDGSGNTAVATLNATGIAVTGNISASGNISAVGTVSAATFSSGGNSGISGSYTITIGGTVSCMTYRSGLLTSVISGACP